MDDARFFIADIETTGLVAATDVVLEVGFKIYGPDLVEVRDEFDIVIWDSPFYDKVHRGLIERAAEGEQAARYILQMHTDNGLWKDCQENGVSMADAEEAIVDFLTGHGVSNDRKTGDPMVGSSIHFDRSFFAEHMPEVDGLFHYRNVDVSSVKELCKRWNPGLYAQLDEGTVKQEKHRAIEDCEDTAGELKFYHDNFFFI